MSFSKSSTKFAVLIALIASLTTPLFAANGTLPGNGTEESPFLIEDKLDFYTFATDSNFWADNIHTTLAADLNFDTQPDPLPYYSSIAEYSQYNGIFNGQNHIITNADDLPHTGLVLPLFYEIGENGQLFDLAIDNQNTFIASGMICGTNEGIINNCNIYYNDNNKEHPLLAGICFRNNGSITNCTANVYNIFKGGICEINNNLISDCTVNTAIYARTDNVGGICAENNHTVSNCTVTAQLDSYYKQYYAGGISGSNSGLISNCQVEFSNTSLFQYIGGISGKNEGTITNCQAEFSSVSANLCSGGICGINSGNITSSTAVINFSDVNSGIGGICGYSEKGSISDCASSGVISGTDNASYIGGLVGSNQSTLISHCSSSVNVSGITAIGGLIGSNSGSVTDSTASGSVTGEDDAAGGLIGASIEGHVTNCSSTGPVSGYLHVGGLIGYAELSDVTNCFSQSSVTGTLKVGGLCGTNYSNIYNSFATGNVTGEELVGGLCGENDAGSVTNQDDVTGIIEDSYSNNIVIGKNSVGGLCGYNRYGTINNCYSASNLLKLDEQISTDTGGFCGLSDLGIITNCYSTGDVSGDFNTGGFLGKTENTTITNSYSLGNCNGKENVGGFCGILTTRSNIDFCSAFGSVNGSSQNVGGFCGYNRYSEILHSYSYSNVTNGYRAGGFCGYNEYGTIADCFATGTVTAGSDSGAFCGTNFNSTITRSFATGSTTGDSNVGGFCGVNWSSTIEQCYSTGSIIGNTRTAGFCGLNGEASIIDSFWDIDSSGIGTLDEDNFGALGKTTTLMQSVATFTEANWDFTTDDNDDIDWLIFENEYPTLFWQYLLAYRGSTTSTATQNEQLQIELEIYSFGKALDWTISGQNNCPWITTVTPDSDSSDGPASPTLVTLTIDTSYLTDNNTAELYITNNYGIPTTIPITINLLLNGTGTKYDPYCIYDFNDFQIFSNPDKPDRYLAENTYIKLMCDLDLDPSLPGRQIYTNSIIAPNSSTAYEPELKFDAIFDGNNHTITNMNIDTAGKDRKFLGLFSYLGHKAIVKNLGLINTIISAPTSFYMGSLCGQNDGYIYQCYSKSGNITGARTIGGICGYNRHYITKSYSTLDINGTNSLGGLCGFNYVGTISHCYSTGTVTGGYDIGAFCGKNEASYITNCYTIGKTSAELNSGAFVDYYDRPSQLKNCYYYIYSGPNNNGGIALDKTQILAQDSYSGFDFPNDHDDPNWVIVQGHCPKLAWQTDDGPLPPTPIETSLLGTGFPEDPFQINSIADFQEFITNNLLHYTNIILNTDLDLNNEYDLPLVSYFSGTLDGLNHTISNISYSESEHIDNIAPFNFNTGTISNLTVDNIDLTLDSFASMIAGFCVTNGPNASLINCHVNVQFNCLGTQQAIAGLCSDNKGLIENCHADCTIEGHDLSNRMAGFCAMNSGTILSSYSTGSISGKSNLGGFCDSNGGIIQNCYTTATLSGTDYSVKLGGFCCSNNGSIDYCYSTGLITGISEIYGFCSKNQQTIQNSFWNIDSSGIGVSGDDNFGATGLTTAQMQNVNTFLNAGWDFNAETANGTANIWHMPYDGPGYPMLYYHRDIPGDITGQYGVDMDDFAALAENWQIENMSTLLDIAEHWLAGK